MSHITRVYVDNDRESCTVCAACEAVAPEVFSLDDSTALVRAEVRVDGITSTNLDERSELDPAQREALDESIRDAAEVCPVEIIIFE